MVSISNTGSLVVTFQLLLLFTVSPFALALGLATGYRIASVSIMDLSFH